MFQKISPGIFAFISENEGSNCFLLQGRKEIALIDSSAEENKNSLLKALESLGLKPANISLVLHTHGHADHFGCDYLFSKAKIVMHEEDARKLNEGNKQFACTQFFPNAKLPKITLFLKEGQKIDLGNLSLKAIHTPGHTEGSVCFFLEKQGLLFSGDTLFRDGFGRTDLSSGNRQKMLQSLLKLQKTPFTALLPGHGPILLGEKENKASLKRIVTEASTNAFL